MDDEQVQAFLHAYLPDSASHVWQELKGASHLELFRTPFFLKLLCDQVETYQTVPKDRAALFTGFVRQVLKREVEGSNPLFLPNGLVSERDHRKIAHNQWGTPYQLPEQGLLLKQLAQLAYRMQEKKGISTESAQVRIKYHLACQLLQHERDADILKAGMALSLLDEDVRQEEVLFFHQLLQEFFAARQVARQPQAELVRSAWEEDVVQPNLADALAKLSSNDPLPLLPQTGWEETMLLATLMTDTPAGFIREISAVNLPLAGRCASGLGTDCPPSVKAELQQALIARTQDRKADVRARIAAGYALGQLGDPRFERKQGKYGEYLLPPLITIPADTYPMGSDDSGYANERPAHTVKLATFQMGQFPVTNAEFAWFMRGRGYEEERWWDTPEALAWLKGQGSTEGSKQQTRDGKQQLQGWSDHQIQGLVNQNRITSEQAELYIWLRDVSGAELEQTLERWYPSGKTYRQPRYWDDDNYNHPAQPVVGVSWFEARAYANWLTAQTSKPFVLPSEAQFEAAARGKAGRVYPYGEVFEVSKSNTFESHLRRPTPIGIFDNATPEGIFDLSGNAYTWTNSIYDPEQFSYPYQPEDGRENIRSSGRRVLRGGSFGLNRANARSSDRSSLDPSNVNYNYGFRLVVAPSFATLTSGTRTSDL